MPIKLTITATDIVKALLEKLNHCIMECSDCVIQKDQDGEEILIFPDEASWTGFANTLAEEIYFDLQDMRYQLKQQLSLSLEPTAP